MWILDSICYLSHVSGMSSCTLVLDMVNSQVALAMSAFGDNKYSVPVVCSVHGFSDGST